MITGYTLIDPRTNEIRYVGITKQTMPRRVSGHLADAKRPNVHSYRVHWIRELLACGVRPVSVTQATFECLADAYAWEVTTIASFRVAAGCKLVNNTDGGDGVTGHRHSEATKRTISLAHTGRVGAPRTEEWLRHMSEALTGKNVGLKHSPTWRANQSKGLTGKPKSTEHRKKIGDTLRGVLFSPERRTKMVIGQLKRKLVTEILRAWECAAQESEHGRSECERHYGRQRGQRDR